MKTNVLDELLTGFLGKGIKGCSAAVFLHGEKVYEGHAGYADDDKGIPTNTDTRYRMYSVSKVFTSVATMQLYEKGLFELSDPLYMYLPEFRNAKVWRTTGNGVKTAVESKKPILVKDLLSMQAGLTYGGDANKTELQTQELMESLEAKGFFSAKELSEGIARIPLVFEPGDGFYYSYGYDVLPAFIEALSGMPFAEYMKKNVFKKAGLEHTCFFREEMDGKDLSEIYTWEEEGKLVPFHEMEGQFTKAHRWESGGQGLIATVRDVAAFGSVLSTGGGDLIGRKTIDLMRRNHLSEKAMADFRRTFENGWPFLRGYGYGLGVRTLLDPAEAGGNGSAGEFGWGGLAGTFLLIDPAEELAIAYGHQIVGNAIENNLEGYCHPRLKQAVYAQI